MSKGMGTWWLDEECDSKRRSSKLGEACLKARSQGMWGDSPSKKEGEEVVSQPLEDAPSL